MRSISADDLHTIAISISVMIFQYPVNLLCDLVYWQISIHRDQSARALIVVRYRTSLLLVCRNSGLNYFQPVVIAGHQLRPIHVADFIHAGRLEVDVIDPSTGGTRTASSDPEQ
jgi:hypothetical protein